MNIGIFLNKDDSSLFGPLEGSGKLSDRRGLGQWPCTMIFLRCILVVKAGSTHKMALFKESRLFRGRS